MRRPTLLIAAWILFALAIRWHFSPPTPPADPAVDDVAIRAGVQATAPAPRSAPAEKPSPTLKALGVRELRFERFDRNARVVVGVGDDGQPGVAGIDDGYNGKTDDRQELGATGSDDTFDIIPGERWGRSDRPAVESILAIGAWVPTTDRAQRCTVIGKGFEMVVLVE